MNFVFLYKKIVDHETAIVAGEKIIRNLRKYSDFYLIVWWIFKLTLEIYENIFVGFLKVKKKFKRSIQNSLSYK